MYEKFATSALFGFLKLLFRTSVVAFLIVIIQIIDIVAIVYDFDGTTQLGEFLFEKFMLVLSDKSALAIPLVVGCRELLRYFFTTRTVQGESARKFYQRTNIFRKAAILTLVGIVSFCAIWYSASHTESLLTEVSPSLNQNAALLRLFLYCLEIGVIAVVDAIDNGLIEANFQQSNRDKATGSAKTQMVDIKRSKKVTQKDEEEVL